MHYPRAPLPYVLEDRTGLSTHSDYDDQYDRVFLRVAPSSSAPNTLNIYAMPQRASRHRDALPFDRPPAVVLDFNRTGRELGTVSFAQKGGVYAAMGMSKYLRKNAMFGGCVASPTFISSCADVGAGR
jgi:hypothetical protein